MQTDQQKTLSDIYQRLPQHGVGDLRLQVIRRDEAQQNWRKGYLCFSLSKVLWWVTSLATFIVFVVCGRQAPRLAGRIPLFHADSLNIPVSDPPTTRDITPLLNRCVSSQRPSTPPRSPNWPRASATAPRGWTLRGETPCRKRCTTSW